MGRTGYPSKADVRQGPRFERLSFWERSRSLSQSTHGHARGGPQRDACSSHGASKARARHPESRLASAQAIRRFLPNATTQSLLRTHWQVQNRSRGSRSLQATRLTSNLLRCRSCLDQVFHCLHEQAPAVIVQPREYRVHPAVVHANDRRRVRGSVLPLGRRLEAPHGVPVPGATSSGAHRRETPLWPPRQLAPLT